MTQDNARPDLESECQSMMADLSHDELRVIAVQMRRMINIGRTKYGGLDLSKEKRNWHREQSLELADYLFYKACEEVAGEERRQELVIQFKEALNDNVQAWNDQFENDDKTGDFPPVAVAIAPCSDCGATSCHTADCPWSIQVLPPAEVQS